MDDQTQFNNVCNKLFEKVFDKLESIDDRLFKDNGHKSVQTCLNETKNWQENHDKIKFAKSGLTIAWLIGNWHKIVIGLVAVIWSISSTVSAIKGTPPTLTIEQIRQITIQLQGAVK